MIVLCAQTGDDDDVLWIANWQHVFMRAVVSCVFSFLLFFFQSISKSYDFFLNETLHTIKQRIHVMQQSNHNFDAMARENTQTHVCARAAHIVFAWTTSHYVLFSFFSVMIMVFHFYVFRLNFDFISVCSFYFPFIQAIQFQVAQNRCVCVRDLTSFIVMKLYEL